MPALRLALLALLALALVVAGCVPARRPPPTLAAVAPPLSWRDVPAGSGAVEPRWWRAYGDANLDALVNTALARNTDVLTAIAAVEQSRAEARLARADLFPTVNAIGNAQIAGQSGGADDASATTVKTLEAGGLLTWQIDLFGRVRALTEAARRRYVASQADRDATALMVTQQVVQAYVQLLAVDAQVQLTRDTAASRQETVRLEQDRFTFGYDSRQEYLQARGEYEAVVAQLPTQLLAQRRQENALAVLTGEVPRALVRARQLTALRNPAVPVSVPSSLLRRRPDIAAAEYRLAATDATIAARRAEFLPQVNLTASGLAGWVFGPMGEAFTTSWSIGNGPTTPLITLPLFQGGRLTANLDAATAARDQAAFAYKAAVLQALREVEDALAGTTRLTEQLAARRQQIGTARQSLGVLQDRFGEGYADFLDVLDAQRSLFAAQQAAITALSDQLSNTAALAAAFGGGWSGTQLTSDLTPAPAASRPPRR